jgi:hypothetical protein
MKTKRKQLREGENNFKASRSKHFPASVLSLFSEGFHKETLCAVDLCFLEKYLLDL